jgi:hypothetical protein
MRRASSVSFGAMKPIALCIGERRNAQSHRCGCRSSVKDMTGGKGADISIRSAIPIMQQRACKQIFIARSTGSSSSTSCLYRGWHTYFGVDTLDPRRLNPAELMREMAPHFRSGALRPFPIEDRFTFPFTRAKDAYMQVIGSASQRVVLVPEQ